MSEMLPVPHVEPDAAGELDYIRGELLCLAERIARRRDDDLLSAMARNLSDVSRSVTLPTAGLARKLFRARRYRDGIFTELMADPVWDILLDLYAASEEGRRITVSSACIAASVPATTALRWIKIMTEKGLIERRSDQSDGRKIYLNLSAAGREATALCLARFQDILR